MRRHSITFYFTYLFNFIIMNLSIKVTLAARFLTIIPRARVGSESIAHEAEGRMGY